MSAYISENSHWQLPSSPSSPVSSVLVLKAERVPSAFFHFNNASFLMISVCSPFPEGRSCNKPLGTVGLSTNNFFLFRRQPDEMSHQINQQARKRHFTHAVIFKPHRNLVGRTQVAASRNAVRPRVPPAREPRGHAAKL